MRFSPLAARRDASPRRHANLRRAAALTIEPLEDRCLLSASLVRDIWRGGGSAFDYYDPINVNGTLFFMASDGIHGRELWKSDGTTDGTVLVKDIRPGSASAFNYFDPRQIWFLNGNGTLFFAADDGVTGVELWKSDGTSDGTVLVKDINPGPARGIGDTWASDTGFIWANDALFFAANDGVTGHEPWKSDGTAAGTSLLRDIYPGNLGSSPRFKSLVNSQPLFTVYPETCGGCTNDLWRTDGTTLGTTLVSSLRGNFLHEWTVANNALFFATYDEPFGMNIENWVVYKSDGTPSGTIAIAEMEFQRSVCEEGDIFLGPMLVNGTLFFALSRWVGFRDCLPDGTQLWRSDGMPAGTRVFWAARDTLIPQMAEFNGALVFTLGGDGGSSLWRSDGSTAGTLPIREGIGIGGLTNVSGTLFFNGADSSTGRELWRSDGTSAGTTLVRDIYPGPASSNPGQFLNVNGTLFFTAIQGPYGTENRELWKSDGTAAGTIMAADINPGSASSNPWGLVNVNGTLFFSASEPTTGRELWKYAAPLAYYYVYPDYATVAAGTPFDLYVLALDASFRLIPGYTGEVFFWSTDPAAVLPPPYTFRPGDQGIVAFPGGVTLRTPGTQVLLVFDTATFSVFGYAAFEVVGAGPGGAPGSGAPPRDSGPSRALVETPRYVTLLEDVKQSVRKPAVLPLVIDEVFRTTFSPRAEAWPPPVMTDTRDRSMKNSKECDFALRWDWPTELFGA